MRSSASRRAAEDGQVSRVFQIGNYLEEQSLTDLFRQNVDISFFVPCYNEEETVVGAIEKLDRVATHLKLKYEILIFDDCSKDRTVEVVKGYQETHPHIPVALYTNQVNRGVARNFVEGAFRARGKYYRLVCGDDIEPSESHAKLLERIGSADIVVPYFTQISGRKPLRHLISWLYTRLVNLCSGFRLRYYNGCPIYARYDVLRFHVEVTGFGYQAEFLTRLLHEKRSYVEVPLTSIDREGGTSLSFRNFISVGHTLLKISLRRLRLYWFK
jgi:glycosyltransferase involved in cell wall biosynthesis